MANNSGHKAVVVGSSFGGRVHVPALRAAGFDVVAMVGQNAERTDERAKKLDIPQAFTDLQAALDATGASIVTISSPPASHCELTLQAIERGCHVICEKPMAATLQEAEQMLAAAEQAGIVHLIGHQFRWAEDRQTIAWALAQDLVGEPRMLTLNSYLPIVADPEKQMPDWWFDASQSGGWLGAHGSHILDQTRAWLGEFSSLSAALPLVSDRKVDVEDSYALRFAMANGVEGVIQQSGGTWGPISEEVRIAGSKGTLWKAADGIYVANKDGKQKIELPAHIARHSRGIDATELYTELCHALRAGIDGESLDSPVKPPTFADGVAGMKLMDAVRRSAAKGGELIKL